MTMQKKELFQNRYGKWAVVTGASSGIGRSVAAELAARGLQLVLVARSKAELELIARDLSTQYGGEARVVAADLATASGIARIESESQDLDVGLLVAEAGFGTAGNFLDAKLADELAMTDLNCREVMQSRLNFGKRFAKRGRGGLILFGSLVGCQGTPHAAHCAATEAYDQT